MITEGYRNSYNGPHLCLNIMMRRHLKGFPKCMGIHNEMDIWEGGQLKHCGRYQNEGHGHRNFPIVPGPNSQF